MRTLLMACIVLTAGCGDDGPVGPDTGPDDTGVPDSAADAPMPDSGMPDTGMSGEPCAPPPADLPADIPVLDDAPFFTAEEFPFVGFEPRPVAVYLPEDYDEARDYPVIYFTDGQAVLGSGYRAHLAMEELVDAGVIEPHIIVAVFSNLDDRFDELTPDEDPDFEVEGMAVTSGGGEEFARQMVERVKGWVDGRFSTRCGRQHTTIAGFSLGGLMCLDMLMSDSDVFGRGICISPSVWWNDRSVLDRFDAYDGELPLRLWIDVGTNESWMPEILDVLPPDDPTYDHSQAIRGARDMAMSKGMTMGVDLGYYEAIGSFHDVNAVRDRISSLLAFALSDVALTDATISDHDFHVWHEYVEAPPPVHPPAQVTTVSFETRFDSPFVLTWPNDMVTLSSRDEDIATIDADGMVTAVGEGTATFDASFMGLTAEDSVEVRVVVP